MLTIRLPSLLRIFATAAAAAAAVACTLLQPVETGRALIGSPQTKVRQTFGQPTDVYKLQDGTERWIYSKQPMGQQSYAADFDSSGNLSNFRQMLTTSELYKARIDVWTKQDVAEHFGLPREPKLYFPRMQQEVWSYRFLHEGSWPSLFNFYFDNGGVLRRTQVTPDPLADPREKAM